MICIVVRLKLIFATLLWMYFSSGKWADLQLEMTSQLCSFSNPIAWVAKEYRRKYERSELTLLWLPIDTRLHCVLVVHSSKSTMPDWIPWWDPWNASQLMTDVPPEPLPDSLAHTSKPVVETDLTHSAAGSWILTYVLPWLREANTLTSLEPWNWVLKETDWQPWLFWDVSVMLTFPAWNTIASKGNVRNKVNILTGLGNMLSSVLKVALNRPFRLSYNKISPRCLSHKQRKSYFRLFFFISSFWRVTRGGRNIAWGFDRRKTKHFWWNL